jgi:hypothetical protein
MKIPKITCKDTVVFLSSMVFSSPSSKSHGWSGYDVERCYGTLNYDGKRVSVCEMYDEQETQKFREQNLLTVHYHTKDECGMEMGMHPFLNDTNSVMFAFNSYERMVKCALQMLPRNVKLLAKKEQTENGHQKDPLVPQDIWLPCYIYWADDDYVKRNLNIIANWFCDYFENRSVYLESYTYSCFVKMLKLLSSYYGIDKNDVDMTDECARYFYEWIEIVSFAIPGINKVDINWESFVNSHFNVKNLCRDNLYGFVL